MKKSIRFVILSILLFVSQNIFAEYDGRWYSLEEHSSSPGGFGVIGFIIGLACIIFLVVDVLKDNNRENSDKGCLLSFFIGILILAFFSLLSKCS